MIVKKVVTIDRSPAELYSFWHNFEQLPRFMRHLEAVQVTGPGRSHWVAKGPAGKTVEWDAEITDDQPNERIAWRSLEGADVPNAGSVRFTPATGGRGTWVQVELEYDPPGGKAGALVAKIFGEEPEKQVYDDLRAFKQVMEVGEIVLSDATLDSTHLVQRPGQPAEVGGGR
ncbi:MAG TPA: SRPBCC family protein [Chloroflexia bacterium]|nr:SRPBCC family protein [Chloroflexia bacterium]